MGLSDEQRRDTLRAMKQSGSQNKAAKALGIARSTLQDRLKTIGWDGPEGVEFPDFPSEHIPIEDVIDGMVRRYQTARKATDAKTWFPIKFKDSKPIGIMFMGDPHVDDDGCAWPVLKRHIELCRETEGLYAVNIGDSSNAWGGRLIKKYADQETSVHTARRLVEWLLLESGTRWLVWLHGNHEHMGDAGPLLHEMNRRYGTKRVPMLDWEARFVLQFANGSEFKINAAHDFPGNSMWNPIHGPVKAASMGGDVDLYVCGHKHNWAISQWEMAEKGKTPLMIRARGYKALDPYARRIGKYEQEEGQSVLVVFDPASTSRAGRMTAFVDPEEGAAYLAFKRR